MLFRPADASPAHPHDHERAGRPRSKGHALGARHSCGAHGTCDQPDERHGSGALPAM